MIQKKILPLFVSIIIVFASCGKKDPIDEKPVVHTIKTFENARHAFASGHSQTAIGVFEFAVDPTKVEQARMFIKLRCPQGGCNAWDMFSNVRLQHPETGKWIEIARYITPYGVDNAARGRGFVVDVTDFKSLLTGQVKLKSFVEVWGSDGWLVSIEFELTEGTPDYKYYAVEEVLDYASWSLGGVPYGEAHDFVLQKNISIPGNAAETSLRTIITGWGHATPVDPDGRPCAEWCFRNHDVLINSQITFAHEMGPIGCGQNPVQPQNGNWAPDRAGWCPGMEVPVRTNKLSNPFAGNSFAFEYRFHPWTNNFLTSADNKHAYYAISTYVVVKSNEPIEKPVVN